MTPPKSDRGAPHPFDELTLTCLRAMSHRFPNIDAALAEIAALAAQLTLPKGTIHILSDVHGEFKKLKHIINNASGGLRPLVEQTFGDRLSDLEKRELLSMIYYPRETWAHKGIDTEPERRAFLRTMIPLEFELLRNVAHRYSLRAAVRTFPVPYQMLFSEMLFEPQLSRSESYLEALIDPLVRQGRDLEFMRHIAHVVRNLSVAELIVAGDLGDRGPRLDKVVDYIMRQPNVAFTWGNHDVVWMGACLGQEACIATVLRNSLRYRRLAQLEEGYGIPVAPLEKLARTVYADDSADRFHCKGEGLRDPLLMARMQKAIAVMQFKLEGQASRRNPEYGLEHRNLLHHMDLEAGTVTLDGQVYPLLDTRFPTLDPADPYRLSEDERACIDRLRASFLSSQVLWTQMRFVTQRGGVHLVRDHHLIFHGCVPVDAQGEMLSLEVDGQPRRGRGLFDALNRVVHRAFRDRRQKDLDMLWYLWTGPLSPMFGKDKMATFESYLVGQGTLKETKNPYFKLIHQREFCLKIFQEFEIDPDRGLIVNGHVPVKIEHGESPVKDSGLAVTIDGAFSEAYGDQGYTLVLDAARTYIAQHHHFESVDDAILRGTDIIPEIQELRRLEPPRTVGDTELGDEIRHEIGLLELLIRAYRESVLMEA